MNKLLLRQVNKYLGHKKDIPDDIQGLLETISESYDHHERDRKLLERSVEISSNELRELNSQLKKETEEQTKAIYKQLKESLLLINDRDEEIIPKTLDYRKLSQIVEILKDETKKRRIAEIELKNSEHRFRYLIENSADAIIIINQKSKVLYASDSVSRILGYKVSQILGRNAFVFFHRQDLSKMKDHLRRLLQNPGETITMEYRGKKRDGKYIWMEGSATNLLDVTQVGGIVVNFRDITERRKSELALKASNSDLIKSNSELDRFVYSVSHDLRAPLSSMLGVIGLVEYKTHDKSITKDLDLLKDSINRLDIFIKDILDYSRNKRLAVEPEQICFHQMVNYIGANLKHMAANGNKVKVELNVDDTCHFFSDPTRLRVLFNNLISNAMRYSDQEKENPFIKIAIKIDDVQAKISIADNGIGIAREDQDKVFEMFHRVSNQSVGSGLGLYIVKETIEKMKGRIHLKSEYGKGSKFVITLPNLSKNKKLNKVVYA